MLWRRVLILWNFYPRPPRGGRHDYLRTNVGLQLFLSTPSARRATVISWGVNKLLGDFYPRPPRGGRPGHRNR